MSIRRPKDQAALLIIGALLVSLSLLLTAAIDLRRTLGGLNDSIEEVGRSQTVIDGANVLLSTLRDAETGQRGYLLTGRTVYLGPYDSAIREIDGDFDRLRTLLAGDPNQSARLPDIAALVSAKLAELARTITLVRAGDTVGALETVETDQGRTDMERLRTALGNIADTERRLLASRQTKLGNARQRALSRASLAVLAAVVAAGASFWSLMRRGLQIRGQLAETEAELASRIAQLQSIYDSAPVGLSFSDSKMRYVAMNERMATILGGPVEAHLGRTVAEAAPEITSSVEPIYHEVISSGRPLLDIDVRTPIAVSGGEYRSYVASYWPVRNKDGEIVGVNAVILDVTERKAAETALAASEARLRAIYDTVPVGIVTADLPSGRITGRNAYVSQVTGYPVLLSADIESHGDWLSFHADGRRVKAQEYPIARMALTGEEVPDLEVLFDRAGSRRWTRIMGRPIRDAQGLVTGAVVVLVDVDELRRGRETLTQEVAKRTADLAAANAQLEAFAYTVSHDLRAPLRGMEGFARILLDDFKDVLGVQGRRYAERIVAAAERMERLIADLLTYSRLQRVDVALRALDPTSIVKAAAEDALMIAGPDGASIKIASPLPSVLAEPVVLGHVLGILLSNAVKFHKLGEPARIRVWGERRGQRASLWVEDQGIGIAIEHRERIFGAFERLHGQEAYPGTGIGLAIVKAGVERLGGSVEVEASEGQGARFRIELPAVVTEATD